MFSYISFIVVFAVASAAPNLNYSQIQRTRFARQESTLKYGINFPCTDVAPSPTVPTSVHALRPADIKYVAAIGDSLTAASGGDAATIIGLLTQYRGIAWNMGGQGDLSTTVTLPNILRKYNKDLKGQSLGNGDQNSANAKFNVAVPGAVSSDMPAQANGLVDKMIKELGQQEFDSSWKLVTFFIGGNDLCAYCKDNNAYSPQNYINNVRQALDIFKARMPRTLINFVTVLNVAELEDLHDGFQCETFQDLLCKCAVDTSTREPVRAANLEYQRLTNQLIDSGVYDTDDSFTVVRQPFMEHMKVPTTSDGLPDFSYFTQDCFHFSRKGHEAAAIELWDTMIKPVGQKPTVWNLADTLRCPDSAKGFIYTSKNSN